MKIPAGPLMPESVADAIVGFNLSRYFSALNGVNLPVGRVQTATLGLVCARRADRKPQKDAVLRRDGGTGRQRCANRHAVYAGKR